MDFFFTNWAPVLNMKSTKKLWSLSYRGRQWDCSLILSFHSNVLSLNHPTQAWLYHQQAPALDGSLMEWSCTCRSTRTDCEHVRGCHFIPSVILCELDGFKLCLQRSGIWVNTKVTLFTTLKGSLVNPHKDDSRILVLSQFEEFTTSPPEWASKSELFCC